MCVPSLLTHPGGTGDSALVAVPAPMELHSKGQADFKTSKQASKASPIVPHATEKIMGYTQERGCCCGTVKAPIKLKLVGWPWAEWGTVAVWRTGREPKSGRLPEHVAVLGNPGWYGQGQRGPGWQGQPLESGCGLCFCLAPLLSKHLPPRGPLPAPSHQPLCDL